MGFDPQDQEVIRHLSKLRQADNEYPPELLAARRQQFLKRMGEIGLGVGAGEVLQQAAKSAKAAPGATATSTLLEAVLVVAIIAEAGAVTYFYRDKLANVLKTFVASPQVQEIISPAVLITSTDSPASAIATSTVDPTFTPAYENTATPSLLAVSEAPAGVAAGTPTSTPNPGLLAATNPVNPTAVQINSTPDPNGNNGNHYGQTPKPERTKENNGNDDKPPKDEKPPADEQPPKEDNGPPPKDDPKPTKAK